MTAAIGEIVRNGVMFDMKNWGELSGKFRPSEHIRVGCYGFDDELFSGCRSVGQAVG